MTEFDATNCPACRSAVAPGAVRCPSCSELLRDYKECPGCAERVRQAARVCRFCSYRFPEPRPQQPEVQLPRVIRGEALDQAAFEEPVAPNDDIDFSISATPIGGFFCNQSPTSLLMPPGLRVTAHEVNIRVWSMLGLRSSEQKIPLSRVTSVRLTLGVLWGSIVIETFGGGIADFELRGLNKTEARDMVAILEQHVLRRRASANRQTAGAEFSTA